MAHRAGAEGDDLTGVGVTVHPRRRPQIRLGFRTQVAEYFRNSFSAELDKIPTGGNNNKNYTDELSNYNTFQAVPEWRTEAAFWLRRLKT